MNPSNFSVTPFRRGAIHRQSGRRLHSFPEWLTSSLVDSSFSFRLFRSQRNERGARTDGSGRVSISVLNVEHNGIYMMSLKTLQHLHRNRRCLKTAGLSESRNTEPEMCCYQANQPITAVPVCVGSASPRRVVTFLGRCTSGYAGGYGEPSA